METINQLAAWLEKTGIGGSFNAFGAFQSACLIWTTFPDSRIKVYMRQDKDGFAWETGTACSPISVTGINPDELKAQVSFSVNHFGN